VVTPKNKNKEKAGTRGVGAMWTATALLNASMGVLETAGQA